MNKYVGLDVHAKTCTMAVLDGHGRVLEHAVVATRERDLIEAIKGIDGAVHLCMEEGTQSNWLYRILNPLVAECLVVGVEKRRRRQNKSDFKDATNLADMVRMRKFHTVIYKETGQFLELKALMKTHRFCVEDSTRAKNRLKSLYRSEGYAADASVYTEEGHAVWLTRLPTEFQLAATTLFDACRSAVTRCEQAERAMVAEARKFPVFHTLMTCPGIGQVRAAQLLAVVVNPHRFRTKRKFWSVCGLAVMVESSADWESSKKGEGFVRRNNQRTRGLKRNCNPLLKNIFKGAAHTVITQLRNHPLSLEYHAAIKRGVRPELAELTLARKLASIVLAVFKTNIRYQPELHARKPPREGIKQLQTETVVSS